MSSLINAIKNRRTHYALSRKSTVPDTKIVELVNDAVLHTPTAFNSQNGRVLVLLNGQHDKLWQITHDALKAIVPAENFPATAEKVSGFAAAYGTVLFFEDLATVKSLQEAFPLYQDNFPVWSQQANGMLQSNVWVALAEAGLGASLQHYSELIDKQVRAEWNVPDSWKLTAQMPFGEPAGQPGHKEFLPLEGRVLG